MHPIVKCFHRVCLDICFSSLEEGKMSHSDDPEYMQLVPSGAGTISVEGLNFLNAIRRWWNGEIGLMELFNSICDMADRICDRYFNQSKAMALRNAYTELGLKYGEKDETKIDANFRALAFVHHPDRGGNMEKFKEITLARDIIKASLGK